MTEIARLLFEDSIYHAYNRGHNHMDLFRDVNDFLFYLKCIEHCREKIEFEVYAICLMTNHYHILIRDVGKNLPLIMDTINSVYARYFNEKYNHKGCVFDGPFKSNPILNDYGFTRVYRYIIRNPVAAGMTFSIYEYPWVTTTKDKDILGIINFEYINEVFKKVCNMNYNDYLKSDEDDLWVDEIEIHKMEDELANELFYIILHKLTGEPDFNRYIISEEKQKQVIQIACFRGITLRQLTKITKLNINTIRDIKDKL